jgi:hypothetical protein
MVDRFDAAVRVNLGQDLSLAKLCRIVGLERL